MQNFALPATVIDFSTSIMFLRVITNFYFPAELWEHLTFPRQEAVLRELTPIVISVHFRWRESRNLINQSEVRRKAGEGPQVMCDVTSHAPRLQIHRARQGAWLLPGHPFFPMVQCITALNAKSF